MAQARAEFRFEVNDLWIDAALLGRAIDVQRDNALVRVRLPRAEEGSTFENPRQLDFDAFGGSSSSKDGRIFREIRMLHAEVTFDLEVTAAEVRERTEGATGRAFEGFERAAKLATDVVTEITEWVRIKYDQTWLGLHGSEPKVIGALPRLLYDSVGENIPVGWPPVATFIYAGREDTAVDESRLAAIERGLADGYEAPLPEAFAADADFLMRSQVAGDWSRAVLLAAIACEVAVKETLRRAADRRGVSALLDVLLSNPRDFSVAALALFDPVLDAVAGVSLRRADKPLYTQVSELFTLRNRVAHRGEVPTAESAKAGVATARRVIPWLRSIEAA